MNEQQQLEQLNQQLANIGTRIETAPEEDLEALNAELTQLIERRANLSRAIETRAALHSRHRDESTRLTERRSTPPLPHEDRSNTRHHQYSLSRALSLQLNGRQIDGLEGETHAELESRAVRYGLPRNSGTFLAPLTLERRDTDRAGNAALIPTQIGDVVDLLRSRTVTGQLGATYLSDLNTNLDLPRVTAGAQSTWSAEGSFASSTDFTSSALQLRPKTLTSRMIYSRQLLNSVGSLSVEQMLRTDMEREFEAAVDTAAFQGSGSDSPTGLATISGPTTVAIGTNGGAPTYAHLVSLEETVDTANALAGRLAYATSAKGRSKLKRVLIDSNTAGRFLWDEDMLNGYPAVATTAVPSTLTKGSSGAACSAVFFGNWADLLIASWGMREFLALPDTTAPTRVNVYMFNFLDINLRRTASFARIVDMTTT